MGFYKSDHILDKVITTQLQVVVMPYPVNQLKVIISMDTNCYVRESLHGIWIGFCH